MHEKEAVNRFTGYLYRCAGRTIRCRGSYPAAYSAPFDLGLAVLLMISLAVGLIGLLCLWNPARYIFAAAVVGMIMVSPLYSLWWVHTSWELIFFETSRLLEGVIIALVYFGPAKVLFTRKDKKI